MRISFISTYPPTECGIATYTRDLREALDARDHETSVVAQMGACGDNVFPVYRADQPYVDDLFAACTRLTPDVVHVQHEYGLFGPHHGAAFVDLLLRFKLCDVPVVTTLHTVYESLTSSQRIILDEVARHSAGLIVHEDYQKATLLNELGGANPGLADRVHVIEHGVRQMDPVPGAKAKLGLEGRKVVMLCGYFRESKCFHRVIDMLPELIENEPEVTLVLAGKVRGVEARDYRDKLIKQAQDLGVSDEHLRIFRGQFPQHTFDTVLSAADVICLPYRAGAQSGMLCQCLALGRPVVTSDLQAFRRVFDRAGGGMACGTDEQFVAGILQALQDGEWRKETLGRAKRYIAEHSGWSNVAERHEAAYCQATHESKQPGTYVYFPECGDAGACEEPGDSVGSDEAFGNDFEEPDFESREPARVGSLPAASPWGRPDRHAGSRAAVEPGVPGAGGLQPGRMPLR